VDFVNIQEAIEISARYDTLAKKVSFQTSSVFKELKDIYDGQLWTVNGKKPGVVGINETSSDSKYNFKIKDNQYSLFILSGPALVRTQESEINSGFPVQQVVEDIGLSRYFAGCITLTVRIEKQFLTLIRWFVNADREIAYEFGIGWKHPFYFEKVEDLKTKVGTFFHEPINESLLNQWNYWKDIKDIKVVDDITVLQAGKNKIGFN
jgi:hypothetical protein